MDIDDPMMNQPDNPKCYGGIITDYLKSSKARTPFSLIEEERIRETRLTSPTKNVINNLNFELEGEPPWLSRKQPSGQGD